MNSSWLDRNRRLVFIMLLLVTAGGLGIFYLQQPAPGPIQIQSVEGATATPVPIPSPTPTLAPVRVYVTGAVVNSDVYFLPPGSIIRDAIIAAGGFTPEADREHINQAQELQDQQQIYVPRLGEANAPPPVQGGPVLQKQANQPASRSAAPAPTGGLINLNTATLAELDSLPGIGPAIAQRIIEYREKAGGFKSVDQITEVSGIGEATLAKIKDLVTVK